jgi:hypothetical protein
MENRWVEAEMEEGKGQTREGRETISFSNEKMNELPRRLFSLIRLIVWS